MFLEFLELLNFYKCATFEPLEHASLIYRLFCDSSSYYAM